MPPLPGPPAVDLSEATRWIDENLAARGHRRTSAVALFRERVWSTVLRAETTAGTVWLKAPGAAFEVGLYGVLAADAAAWILEPIAIDLARGWLLLPDGGPTFYQRYPHDDRFAALPSVLSAYGQMQRSLAGRVPDMLAAGLADMRPEMMPQRFDVAVAVIECSPRTLEMRERFAAWCADLTASPIPASLDHNDLHGENILPREDGTIRFYDFGDAVIAHPFASMLMGLGSFRYTDDVTEADPRLLRARDAYLEVFGDLGSRAELVEVMELACRVGKVARALVWHRVVSAFPDAEPAFVAAPRESLDAVVDDSYLTGA